MAEEIFLFLPVFVHKNPPAMIHPEERYIHYPWFQDKARMHWTIVSGKKVVEGSECLERGDELNALLPALLRVCCHKLQGSLYRVCLGDLDGKWVDLPGEALLELTEAEAMDRLRDAGWVETKYGKFFAGKKNADDLKGTKLRLRDGLIRRDET